jgi:type I restriction enzyme S subunit
MPVPLPPLAEQKRIVAKVDELMAICDGLEVRQTKKRVVGTRLTKAAVDALTTAESPEESDAAWKLVVENFDVLIDGAEKVDELRKAVLDLAIRGKLIRQDPSDEPADEWRTRIIARVGGGQSPREPPPFTLPTGWTWARFPELGVFGRGKSRHRPRNAPILFQDGKYPMVQTGDVARANGEITTFTSLYSEAGLAQSRLWPKGTLCITIAANIADSGILAFDACFPDSVVGFVPNDEFHDARYFEYFLRTAKRHIEDFAPATAQKNINLEILGAVLIPLPPKAEMLRIVRKVDELMKLCDDLEGTLRRAEERATKLVEAVVQELVA